MYNSSLAQSILFKTGTEDLNSSGGSSSAPQSLEESIVLDNAEHSIKIPGLEASNQAHKFKKELSTIEEKDAKYESSRLFQSSTELTNQDQLPSVYAAPAALYISEPPEDFNKEVDSAEIKGATLGQQQNPYLINSKPQNIQAQEQKKIIESESRQKTLHLDDSLRIKEETAGIEKSQPDARKKPKALRLIGIFLGYPVVTTVAAVAIIAAVFYVGWILLKPNSNDIAELPKTEAEKAGKIAR